MLQKNRGSFHLLLQPSNACLLTVRPMFERTMLHSDEIFKVFVWDERRVVVLWDSFDHATVLDLDAFTAEHCEFRHQRDAEDITFDSLTGEMHFHSAFGGTAAFKLEKAAGGYRLSGYRYITKLYGIWSGSVTKHARRHPDGTEDTMTCVCGQSDEEFDPESIEFALLTNERAECSASMDIDVDVRSTTQQVSLFII